MRDPGATDATDATDATRRIGRRRYLLAGAATVAALGGVAGCTGGGGGDGDENENGEVDPQQRVDDYLSNDETYDGSIEDLTGESAPTVAVGAAGNAGHFAFDPSAVRVSTGTTVTWEWTGEGSSHNVVHEDGAFESELVVEAGHAFGYTFEETGVFRYYCTPHKTSGMKGAVVVE